MEFSKSRVAVLVLLFCSAQHAFAAETTGAIGSRVSHTDNVRQSANNAEQDVVQTTYAELGVEEVRKRFKADATLKLQNEHYYEGTYDDETSLTSGFGLFTIDLVEEFLEWQATFSRTDVVSKSEQADDPDPSSTEFRNIFRTGPTINYAISRLSNVRLRGTYVRVDNSEKDADDNERAEGSINFRHQLNRLTSINAGGNYSEIIQSDDGDEITNGTVSVGFTRSYVDGALDVSYGQQEVRSSNQNTNDTETEVGSFADAVLTRQALYGHNLALKYNQSISDTSIGFEDDEEGSRLNIDPRQATSITDIETRNRVNFDIARDTDGYTYDLGFIYEESNFKVQQYTERHRGLIVGYAPKLYARLIPRIQYQYARESFGLIKGLGVDTTHTVTGLLKYQLVEELYADGLVSYETRSNDTRASREFDEFTIGLGLRWEFL